MPILADKKRRVYLLNQFEGMNRDGYKYNMPDKFIWDGLNQYITRSVDDYGASQQRAGLVKKNTTAINSSSTKIRYITEARWHSGATDLILRAHEAWYKWDSGTSEFVTFDTGRGADNKGQGVMFANEFMYVDGGHPRRVGSSFSPVDLSTDSTLPDNATCIHVHRNRVWVNDPDNMQVLGSKVDDATSASAWSTADDSVTLDLSFVLESGDEVVGFQTFADTLLLIFCKKNVIVYDAPEVAANISIQEVIPIGALSRYAFAEIGNELVWPRRSGIKTFSSSASYQKLDKDELSEAIASLYRAYVGQSPDEGAICGTFYNALNHYYITIHTGSSSSETLVYSADVGNFVGRYNFHANPFSWYESRDGTLYIGMDNGYVYTYTADVFTDDGNAISYELQWPYVGIETPHRFKCPYEFELLIEANQDTQVSVTIDYTLGDQDTNSHTETFIIEASESFWDEATWDVSSWDEAGRKLVKNYNLTGRGRLIGIKINHAQSGSNVKIVYFFLRCILEGEE